MAELNFATGVVTYTVNGGAELRFNPTDHLFAERLYNTFDHLDKMQEAYRSEAEAAKGSAEVFDLARTRSDEMRGMIDELFQAEVCQDIFGNIGLYAMADGLPVWANFLLAVMELVESTMSEEEKKTSPRVQKYLKKYQKYKK